MSPAKTLFSQVSSTFTLKKQEWQNWGWQELIPWPLISGFKYLLEVSSQALQQDVPGREGFRTGLDRFSLTGSGVPDGLQVGAVVAPVTGVDLDQQVRVVRAIQRKLCLKNVTFINYLIQSAGFVWLVEQQKGEITSKSPTKGNCLHRDLIATLLLSLQPL